MEPRSLDDAFRHEIDDLLDGRASAVDSLRDDLARWEALASRLENDAAARAYLAERAILHATLERSLKRRRLGEWAVEQAQATVQPRAGAPRVTWRWATAGLGALAAVFAFVLLMPAGWDRPCATVTRGVGAGVPTAGTALGREPHDLAAGVLELKTRRGAELVIEAPAAFRFEAPQRLRLSKGRISADVPASAKGFTVVTPSGEAIDLGTRFAVDVPATGEAEVHVFDGEVIARAGAHSPKNLRDGEALSLATNAARELRTAAFIRGGEVAELAAAVAAGQERLSREAMQRLADDPHLIAVVDFEGDFGTPAASEPARPAGQYSLLQGRWPGSQAADFTNVGDHLPLDVGGDADWPQLTVTAWVRLDRLGEPYQSLYHTDGWNRQNPGQVHWMIVDSGVMRLALPGWTLSADAIEQHGHPESLTSVLGKEGRWVHLAFVYDSAARTVRFYVDGRPDGVTTLVDAPPARLGPARVGNWNNRDRKLSGRIDELVFVGRALSGDEIHALFSAGAPYRPRSK